MRDGVVHLGSNQRGRPHRPRKPLQALGASAHGEETQLKDWLERVGTLNAIAAILDAARKQQTKAGQQAAGGSDARAMGIEGLGWLSGAMTAAIEQIQPAGSQEPRRPSIQIQPQVTPVAPLSPHRPANSSTLGQGRWVLVARLSIHPPGSDGDRHMPHRSVPAAADRAPNPQRPSRPQWVTASQEQLQAHLGAFLAQADAAADIKTAVAELLNWWKLHETAISDSDSSELVALLHGFICPWLQQQDPSALSEPTTGLHGAPASSQLTNPELESKLFSCGDVARELNYQESTIRRCAKKSWLCGPGPYPLRGIPSFYVVTRPNPACGRGHGWKFQRIKPTCNASSHSSATQTRGRARHNKATQSCYRHNTCGQM